MNDNLKNLYTDDYFKNRFEGQDLKREKSYIQEYSNVTKYLAKGKVLDIGCGMGNFLEIFDSNFEKYGIEISEYAAIQATKKGIKIIDYEFTEDYFDLIIFRGVFQHLDTPLFSLQKALKMLKKSGMNK